jgi:hypothetical protein
MLWHARVQWIFLFLLIASLGLVPKASAVQTSGALLVTPSNYGPLHNGDTVDVKIQWRNTSTDTPNVPGPPLSPGADGSNAVGATLNGTISFFFSCKTNACVPADQFSGAMQFVPVGATGCVSADPAVTSCAVNGGNPNQVDITLGSSISAGPDGTQDIATVRLKVLDETKNVGGSLRASAMTEEGALNACSTNNPNVCATCEAGGCTIFTFPLGTTLNLCPNRLHMPAGLIHLSPAIFELHLALQPSTQPLVPLSGEAFAVTLDKLNAPASTPVSISLAAGQLTPLGTKFRFSDGTTTVLFTPRGSDQWVLDLISKQPGVAGLTSSDDLALTITLGPDTFVVPFPSGGVMWTMNRNGELVLPLAPCPNTP